MLIVTSLHRDFLPSSWRVYTPSWIDWTILAGTCSFFLLLFLLFLRFVPFIPISELKEMRHELAHGKRHGRSAGGARRRRRAWREPCVTESSPSSTRPRASSGRSLRLKALGYTRLRSWTPYPVRGVVTQLPESLVPWIMLVAGLVGAGARLPRAVVVQRVRLPARRRGPPLSLDPGVHPDRVRVGSARGEPRGVPRDPGPLRAAAPLPPHVRGRRLRARIDRSLLDRGRRERSVVRRRGPRGARDLGGAALRAHRSMREDAPGSGRDERRSMRRRRPCSWPSRAAAPSRRSSRPIRTSSACSISRRRCPTGRRRSCRRG